MIEQSVIDSLTAAEAAYETMPCDPQLADTRQFCEHYGFGLDESANAILVASKRPPGQYAVCLVLANTRLDVNRTVRRLLGVSRLSFASAQQTTEVTGMQVGGVTPFGLPATLPVFVDSAVMARPRVVIGGGSRSMKVVVDPEVFERVPFVEVVEGLALPSD